MEDVAMRTIFDLSPLYRSTVGFDRLLDMLDQAEPATNWPPYNIEKVGDDQYRITMAVAGFSPDEIELVQQESTLFVNGQKHPEPEACRFYIAASPPAPSSSPSILPIT
jgi:molecular chaperone IbpA